MEKARAVAVAGALVSGREAVMAVAAEADIGSAGHSPDSQIQTSTGCCTQHQAHRRHICHRWPNISNYSGRGFQWAAAASAWAAAVVVAVMAVVAMAMVVVVMAMVATATAAVVAAAMAMVAAAMVVAAVAATAVVAAAMEMAVVGRGEERGTECPSRRNIGRNRSLFLCSSRRLSSHRSLQLDRPLLLRAVAYRGRGNVMRNGSGLLHM